MNKLIKLEEHVVAFDKYKNRRNVWIHPNFVVLVEANHPDDSNLNKCHITMQDHQKITVCGSASEVLEKLNVDDDKDREKLESDLKAEVKRLEQELEEARKNLLAVNMREATLALEKEAQ